MEDDNIVKLWETNKKIIEEGLKQKQGKMSSFLLLHFLLSHVYIFHIWIYPTFFSLLQMKYILFVGGNAAKNRWYKNAPSNLD